jgi:hypothetical protein
MKSFKDIVKIEEAKQSNLSETFDKKVQQKYEEFRDVFWAFVTSDPEIKNITVDNVTIKKVDSKILLPTRRHLQKMFTELDKLDKKRNRGE